jgi:divalent metal cation (Fe/Co/Zn/Cd) transporter
VGRGTAASVVTQLLRLALVALGAFLLHGTVRDALAHETSWSVIAIGALAGSALAVTVSYRPERALARRRTVAAAESRSAPTAALSHDSTVVLIALFALYLVVLRLDRYAAATGAFCLLTGAIAYDRAVRRMKAAERAASGDRPGRPS